jgi:predicted porin
MSKKLIAAAIAAAFAVPAAVAADVTTYGIAHISIDMYNGDQGGASGRQGEGIAVTSRASRIGFKGSEDLGGGLKAIWKMEFQINMANDDNGGGWGAFPVNGADDVVSGRNMYVGLAGGFGTFLFGRHDTPYKISTGKLDYFADQLGDYNGNTLGFEDVRANSAIAYISPSFGGLTLAGAVVTPDMGDNTTLGGPNGDDLMA